MKQLKKLLVFTLTFPPQVGGMQEMIQQLSTHIAAAGIEVTVLTHKETGWHEADQRFPGIKIVRFPLPSSAGVLNQFWQKMLIINELRKAIKITRPDGILCSAWDPCAYLVKAAVFFTPIPYFVIVHGMEIMQLPSARLAGFLKKGLRSWGLRNAEKIFAVSRFTKSQTLKLGISDKKIKVIPNGVVCEEARFPEPCRKKGEDVKILFTVSRLVWRKGHDLVIRAMKKIVEKNPGIIYQIAGNGPEKARLEALVKELGLSRQVQFFGEVSENKKKELLRKCDIFVLACRDTELDFEGFGIVLLEAMREGKPVIASCSGGIPEVVRDEKTGILVKTKDPDEWAGAILKILGNPSQAESFGKEGFRTVLEFYQWNVIAPIYINEISACLEK